MLNDTFFYIFCLLGIWMGHKIPYSLQTVIDRGIQAVLVQTSHLAGLVGRGRKRKGSRSEPRKYFQTRKVVICVRFTQNCSI